MVTNNTQKSEKNKINRTNKNRKKTFDKDFGVIVDNTFFRGKLRKVRIGNAYVERLYISNELLKQMVLDLFFKVIDKVKERNFPKKGEYYDIDAIIGIGTGGFVIAKYLYESFKLLYENQEKDDITWNKISNSFGFKIKKPPEYLAVVLEEYSIQNMKKKEVKIKQWFQEPYKNKSLIIVDDVSDGGKTFRKAMEKINDSSPKATLSASLHIKKGTSFIPDVYVEEVPSGIWIVYPFEKESFEKLFIEKAFLFLDF